MKKITISDVAKEADVSKSTVSRVLNNAPNVNDEMRERVLKAIDKLNYQPSRAAQQLKKNIQDVIGFLVPSIKETIFGAVLQGAQDFAYQNKMGIFAYSTADNLERQQMYLEFLQSEQLAGLVIAPAPGTDPNVLTKLREQEVDIVLLDRKLAGFDADFIGSDNIQGAYSAVCHLIEQGYTRIATIAGAQNVSTGIERLTGYRMALTEMQLDMRPEWVVIANFDEEQSYHALQSLIKQDNPPEAIFIANDAMAIGALRAIRDVGIRVPDDLALASFDQLPLADSLIPSMTTVEQATKALGEESLRLLTDLMDNPNRSRRLIQIPTTLHVRESSLAIERIQS
ncbi:MAG: LacI family DNA-binding transcriptional regulator [Chloroflexota bacterium]